MEIFTSIETIVPQTLITPFYCLLFLHSIAGLKYIYLLIIGDYSVHVEEPDQRTYWSKNLSTNRPTNQSTNQPIDKPAILTNFVVAHLRFYIIV